MKYSVLKQKGVASIEFAIGFFAFWLMLIAWVEVSYMSYITSISDYAISEAARQAKKDTQSYQQVFHQVLSNSDSLWAGLVDKNNFSASIKYVSDIAELSQVTEPCLPKGGEALTTCGTEANSAIAIYYINYDYEGLFSYFFDGSTLFSREVIMVQEYERDQFEI
ncbi:TadE family protein [Vibrio maerlii]|uniref:TadE family protein n=1 Tax=Vibrio maerlii TaxID=2231648 RepID=UPI000E3BBF33|nr:TadE family protein [Vibrio maerlii]